MKSNRWYTAAGLLVFLLLCLVPSGQAQTCVPVSKDPASSFQLGLKCNFTSASGSVSGFTASGLSYWQVFFVPSGTVSGATLSLDSSATGLSSSWSTGGVIAAGTIGAMTSAGSYANSSATTPTNFVQLTPTITGTGTVTVALFGYTNNPASSAGGGSVTVSNFPATQAISAASLPLPTNAATSANQVPPGTAGTPNANVQSVQGITGMTPFKVDGSGVTQPVSLATNTPTQGNAGSNAQSWWVRIGDSTNGPAAVKPASTAAVAADPAMVVAISPNNTVPVSLATAPITPTQPSGFGSGVTNQQAVTASAVALPSNAVHGVCVKALSTNTIPVYVGFSGVTTSTGYQLNAGDSVCGQLSNTNLIFVIATTTGASVAFFGN